MPMQILGYQYDFTTVTVSIPGVPAERVAEQLSAISSKGGLTGREQYHGSQRDPSGINDGIRKPSGTLKMTVELLEQIVASPAFANGLDMAPPFNLSITVKANIPPFFANEFVMTEVRLEMPDFDWNNGNKALEVDVNYMCRKRTFNGRPV